jgi:hypothetical protein
MQLIPEPGRRRQKGPKINLQFVCLLPYNRREKEEGNQDSFFSQVFVCFSLFFSQVLDRDPLDFLR